ncbi:MAG: hypothetical protein RLZZ367_2 [Bacteroidota bacterium]|jgi:hypothetical protein
MNTKKTQQTTTVICLLLILLWSQCKKEDNPSTPQSAQTCLSSKIFFNGIDSSLIVRDSNGRISKVQYPTSGAWLEYQYLNDTVFIINHRASGVVYLHGKLILNAQGYAIAEHWRNSTSAIYTEEHQYNTDGYRIQTIHTDSSGNFASTTYMYTWSSGNMTGSTASNGNSVVFEYYPDLVNKGKPENYEEPYAGKLTKNLLKKDVLNTGEIEEYTYILNENGYVTHSSIVSNGSSTFIYDYTYECR